MLIFSIFLFLLLFWVKILWRKNMIATEYSFGRVYIFIYGAREAKRAFWDFIFSCWSVYIHSQTVIKNIEVKARFLRLEGKFFFFFLIKKRILFWTKKIIYMYIFIYIYISQFQLNDPSMVSFFLWILKKNIFFFFQKIWIQLRSGWFCQ